MSRRWAAACLFVVLFAASAVAQKTLYDFESPAQPNSSLVDGSDGFYYGTTTQGGSAGRGEIYKIDLSTGEKTTVVTFNGANGAFPYGDVLVSSQYLYGTTSRGGRRDSGTVYRFDRQANALTTLVSFGTDTGIENGAYPQAGLVARGGLLYGTTSGGGPQGFGGTLFSVDPSTGQLKTLATFTSANATPPTAPLVAVGSVFYGTTAGPAGSTPFGSVFRFDPDSGQLTILGSVDGQANSALVTAGSYLYGTSTDGFNVYGSIFRVDPTTGSVATVYSFDGVVGSTPFGSLIYDGTYLYGTTSEADRNAWSKVFQFDPQTSKVTPVASFNFKNGAYPKAAMLLKDGSLFGTTWGGGPNNGGTIFKLDLTTHALTNIAFFNSESTGANPASSPTIVGQMVFGTASTGGNHGLGTAFKMDLSTGDLSTVASFDFRSGGNPLGALLPLGGLLYGTAATNGVDKNNRYTNNGTVYSIDPASGVINMVAAMNPLTTGGSPEVDLAAAGSFLYGTVSSGGGSDSRGTVFRVDPALGGATPLVRFTFPYTNGSTPLGGLLSYGSSLWGTARNGGDVGFGVIFRVDPSTGAFTRVASINSGATAYPNATLTPCGSSLYGTGLGCVFKVDPGSGAVSLVVSFNGPNGRFPGGGALACDGSALYGTTQYGGAYDHGTVYRVDLATGVLSTLISFNITNGDTPRGGLTVDHGFVYGTTQYGGVRGGGTLFRLPITPQRRRAVRR